MLHKLRMERAADANGGEAVLVNKFGQCQLVSCQTMGAKTGNNIHHRRMTRLQPEREIQFLSGAAVNAERQWRLGWIAVSFAELSEAGIIHLGQMIFEG